MKQQASDLQPSPGLAGKQLMRMTFAGLGSKITDEE